MARGLSYKARGLLRWMVEHQGGTAVLAESPQREELYKAGYIVRGSGHAFEATAAGTECAQRIVRDSGDGPEDLKALFAPLVRRTR